MFRRLLILGVLPLLVVCPARAQVEQRPDVRMVVPISTEPLAMATARTLKQRKGLLVAVFPAQTSLDAIYALGQDQADIALITRPLTGVERAQFPDHDFVTIPIGMQVVALGVSNDLWNAGLHTISQKEMRAIYELKTTNWKEVGGPDEKITMFSFQQGGGVWETLTEWLYGDNRKAPIPKVETLATSQDARDDLEFTPGSIAFMGASLVDGVRCHALGVTLPDHVGQPVPADVAAGKYPIVRQITAVVVGRPTLNIRVVTEFLTGSQGQALVQSGGAFGLDAVPKPPADSQY